MTGPIVVGIPARNEETTVRHVAEMADQGLRSAYPGREHVLILAENGSTDRTKDEFEAAQVQARQIVIGTQAAEWGTGAETGKGANMLSVIAKGLDLGADLVVFLDADVRSVEANWVGKLAQAVDDEAPAMAVPVYQRNRFEANTTAHLATPLLAAGFGRYVQQPIGGEFAINQACMQMVMNWERPESALLYGVDIWLTGSALRDGVRVTDVPLGKKLHTPPFVKVLRMPQQVLDAAFHVIASTDRPRSFADSTPAAGGVDDGAGTRPDQELVEQVSNRVTSYIDQHRTEIDALFPSLRIDESGPHGQSNLGVQRWPLVLADALTALAGGRFVLARDHLIALYVRRIFAWWQEIEHLDAATTSELVQLQARETARIVGQRDLTFSGLQLPHTWDRGLWAGIGDLPPQLDTAR